VAKTEEQRAYRRRLVRAASRTAPASAERGLTLVELTTSTVVLLVVLTAAWLLLTATGSNLNRIQFGGQASEGNRAALAALQRDVDRAISPTNVSPIFYAGTRTVSMYSDVDSDTVPETVTWTADDTRHLLLRVVTDGSVTATTTVLDGLTDGPSDVMFTYAQDAEKGWEPSDSVTTSTVGLVGMRVRNALGPDDTKMIIDRSATCRVTAYLMNTLPR
jgi:hypothetical protein